jgi:hypothetical protein
VNVPFSVPKMGELRILWPQWLTKMTLLFSGWYPSRDVWSQLKLPDAFESFPEAKRILAKFGGLKFGPTTDYTCFDPSAANKVIECIKGYEKKIGLRLYPLGVCEHQDIEYLLVDERGIIYLLADELKPMASSFDRALQYLVWQVWRQRDIDQDLQRVGMAGKTWRLDDGSWPDDHPESQK